MKELLDLCTQINSDLSIPKDGLQAVFYTDGGCRPTPRGFGGYGLHGYLCTLDVPKKGHGCKGFVPTEEGYVEGNAKTTQSVTVHGYLDYIGSMNAPTTNNAAELFGMIAALETVGQLGIKKAVMLLDSRYVIDGTTKGLNVWPSKGWKNSNGQTLPNLEQWMIIKAKKEELESRGVTIDLFWVEAHTGDIGNTLADGNATKGVFAASKSGDGFYCTFEKADTYWKDPEIHPLMAEARWYFLPHSNRVWNDRYVYHITTGTSKPNIPVAKPHAESSHAILFTKEPIALMESLFDAVKDSNLVEPNRICISVLSNLYKRSVRKTIEQGGTQFAKILPPSNSIISEDKVDIVEVLDPPLISMRVVEDYQWLETIARYISEYGIENIDKVNLGVFKITEAVFEKHTKANKEALKVKGEQGDAFISVPFFYEGKDIDVVLNYGIDLPRRRALANITDVNPEVYLITWAESDVAFRFVTYVETSDACGIWSGTYSNLRLVNKP